MPFINPSLVPTINPGDLFDQFTTETSLNIRWLTVNDPAYADVLNRPMADITLRQLILAKALDDLNVSLGYQAIFPFVIPPQVQDGSSMVYVPIRLFWDFHVSIPIRWTNLRLARIDRLDGDNSGSSGYTGTLRFIFTAQQFISGMATGNEIALFYADYQIDSPLDYQRVRIQPATMSATPGIIPISVGEHLTIDGEIIFRTLDHESNSPFFDLLAPGTAPTQYEIVDFIPGSETGFSDSPLSHGTGLLTSSSINYITPVDADPITWIESFNYPFDLDATRQASDSSGVTIPSGMFREMNITAPAGDEPTGGSPLLFPVWISRIESNGAPNPTLTFYFSTHSVDPSNVGQAIEFGMLDLTEDMSEGQVVNIIPSQTLWPTQTTSDWHQEFGRGHVVLSNKWISGGEVTDLFDSFPTILGSPSVSFSRASTRIGSWGLSRIPRYTPTLGQSLALLGTAARRNTPIHPYDNNRYVTEKDEGDGDKIDLDSQLSPIDAIDRYGRAGTRVHMLVKLIVDPEKASENPDPYFYENQILPRLRILLGRDPVFGDEWFNGTRFMKFNGEDFGSWVG